MTSETQQTMTNVLNSSTNSALTSNVHGTSITQQPDDLLPSLASLSFSVNSTVETSLASSSSVVAALSSPSAAALSVAHVVQSLKDDSHETTSYTNSLLSPIVNNNTVDAKDLAKKLECGDLQGNATTNMLSVLTSQSTGNGASVSPSSMSSGNQPSFDFTTKLGDESSVAAMWSNIDDGSNHNGISNGFKSNSNYSNSLVTTLMNNTNNMTNMQQQQQHQQHQQQQQHQNRRAITASHGGFQPGLPPNNCTPPQRNMMPSHSIQQHPHGNHHPHNMHQTKSNAQDHSSHHLGMQQPQQQQQHHPHQQMNFHQNNAIDRNDPMHDAHRHSQKPNMYNSNYPVWSNPASSMPWQAQQQQNAINNSIPVSECEKN